MRITNKCINTIILENQTVRKVVDFTYLGNNASQDGGAVKDVNIRIQKTRGTFSRLRKICQSTHIHKSTKIKIFTSCVKCVLLYGCETWLVSAEIQRKLQSFINRCLRHICRIWWPRVMSNEKLWKETNEENINIEIRWRKFSWIGHTLGKSEREPCKATLMWNPQGSRKRGRAKEQLAEKHVSRSREKELEGAETYCQRQEKMKGTRRQTKLKPNVTDVRVGD
jgi:hypothetical protein